MRLRVISNEKNLEGSFSEQDLNKKGCECVYQTVKRFLQLDPVLVDEVAVVFSMPEASVAL